MVAKDNTDNSLIIAIHNRKKAIFLLHHAPTPITQCNKALLPETNDFIIFALFQRLITRAGHADSIYQDFGMLIKLKKNHDDGLIT